MSKTVLVVGATGLQGGLVIKELLASSTHFKIRATSRSTDSEAVRKLQSQGIEVVKADLSDRVSLEKALRGVDSAFLVTSFDNGVEREEADGKTFIDVAKKVNLPYLVFTSVGSSDQQTGVPHFDSKFVIEQHLDASGIKHTILRPVVFYDNFSLKTGLLSFLLMGVFEAALHGRPLQMIAVKDIAWFAVRALEEPDKYASRKIELAGDNLTTRQVQDAYARVEGHSVSKAWLPGLVIRLLPDYRQKMFWWFRDVGYRADISTLRKEHPGLLTFEQWLEEGRIKG